MLHRLCFFALLAALMPLPLYAASLPNYDITLDNGKISPQTLHVKAGERFKLSLKNSGNTPVEFESTSLRKEKVMGPGVSSFVVVHPLKPGSYDFFDDFHPDAHGTLIAE